MIFFILQKFLSCMLWNFLLRNAERREEEKNALVDMKNYTQFTFFFFSPLEWTFFFSEYFFPFRNRLHEQKFWGFNRSRMSTRNWNESDWELEFYDPIFVFPTCIWKNKFLEGVWNKERNFTSACADKSKQKKIIFQFAMLFLYCVIHEWGEKKLYVGKKCKYFRVFLNYHWVNIHNENVDRKFPLSIFMFALPMDIFFTRELYVRLSLMCTKEFLFSN